MGEGRAAAPIRPGHLAAGAPAGRRHRWLVPPPVRRERRGPGAAFSACRWPAASGGGAAGAARRGV